MIETHVQGRSRPAPARWLASVAACVAPFIAGRAIAAQTTDAPPRWEFGGLPALGFDADDGWAYGALVELYGYGAEGPYRFTVQPAVLLTTEGRRDFNLFFDAPNLLPGAWRVTVFLGADKHIAAPWYGAGNATAYDPALDAADGPDPWYYRYGRSRRRASLDLQRPLLGPVRVLVGMGLANVDIDETPHDQGATLLADQATTARVDSGRRVNFGRVGIVWDTRDREIGPSRGVWTEAVVQRVDDLLGSDADFTRWTVTDRRYFPVAPRLVFANRVLLQGTHGQVPFHELQVVQTSGRPQEGLGGARTIRGLPKNRYAGEAFFLWNVEMRWRVLELERLGRSFRFVLTGFADSGRTWASGLDAAELFQDHHLGLGGGVRVGMGESFVGGFDVGRSSESTASLYVGLGYSF